MEAGTRGMTVEHYVENIIRYRHLTPDINLKMPPQHLATQERVADAMEQMNVAFASQTKLIERSVLASEQMVKLVGAAAAPETRITPEVAKQSIDRILKSQFTLKESYFEYDKLLDKKAFLNRKLNCVAVSGGTPPQHHWPIGIEWCYLHLDCGDGRHLLAPIDFVNLVHSTKPAK